MAGDGVFGRVHQRLYFGCQLDTEVFKIKGGEGSKPSVTGSVKLSRCQNVRQWVVVRYDHKTLPIQIVMEFFCYTPLQSQKFQLVGWLSRFTGRQSPTGVCYDT